jgi:ATP-dependent DNA helicase DinG
MSPSLPFPALVATHAGVWRADATGQTRGLSRTEAVGRLADTPHLLLNAPLLASRLGLGDASGLDLLELFAFVHPARFAVPSAVGLAERLTLSPPATPAAEPAFLQLVAARLLETLRDPLWPFREGAAQSLDRLARRAWPWAPIASGRKSPRATTASLTACSTQPASTTAE